MKKKERTKKIRIRRTTKTVFIILVTVFLIGILLSIMIYVNRTKEPLNTVFGYLITITSLVISVIALVIAMITYFSIDSVNSVTAMEGNVLENPQYTIAYFEMVMQFSKCKNQKEFMDLLLDIINHKYGYKTSTCIQFADWLQTIIDHLIWFAYVDFNDKEFTDKCERLVSNLEKDCLRYNSLSNGIQYLINENVKLIKYVLIYQKSRNLEQNQICHLENIRGKMILNPISQIVYYDYLGLDYRRKANKILQKCGNDEKEFTYNYMNDVLDYKYTEEDIRHIYILLNRAKECFNDAGRLAETDVLWEGYIKYNEVRLRVMEYLLQHTNKEDILIGIKDVINIREAICFLFNEPNAFLSKKFKEEYDMAVSLYENFARL